MGSAGHSDASQKAVEGDLIDAGNKLLAPPSSTDELLVLVDKAESLLAVVWQRPPMSTCKALLPVMKALITDELLRHIDVNVQVAVASCFSELSRITAPEPPYNDEEMKVIFQLFMVAFKQLSCESGCNYSRALQILETMAKVRSALLLLDIDSDGLVVEMFQLFLNNIRSNHPYDVFKHMEMIMTWVIRESDGISSELLRPLLASVKIDNKNASPISWELGKKVFENCATKLQRYLREAVKEMNLDIGDYAEVVTSICHDASNGRNMVSLEVEPTDDDWACQLNGLANAVDEDCAPQTSDGNGTKLDDEISLEERQGCQQIVQSGTDTGALRRRKGRKSSSVIRPEERHEDTRNIGLKYSGEVSSDGYNDEKNDLILPSEVGNSSMLNDSSQKKNDSFNEGSLRKRGRLKKKESLTNQHNDLEFSPGLKRKILQTRMKERGGNVPKKTPKRAITGSSNIRVEKEGGILSDTGTEGKQELLPQEQYERKEVSEEIISQKHVKKDVANKMGEFPTSKHAKAKFLRKEREKKSRRSRVDYGEELVNSRIQVWWPMDKTFYAGTIQAFDPVTKKHKIKYDDDEIEILNLRKETWELLIDKKLPQFCGKPSQKQEANDPSHARETVKTQEKTAKRQAGTSKRQHGTSSSKRSKHENHSTIKSGESSPNFVHVIESDDEMFETNAHDGENSSGK